MFVRGLHNLKKNVCSPLQSLWDLTIQSPSRLSILVGTLYSLQLMWDLTSIEEGNETFFIKGWKLLPSRRVLKTLRENSKRKIQREQYLPMIDFDYHSTIVIGAKYHVNFVFMFFFSN